MARNSQITADDVLRAFAMDFEPRAGVLQRYLAQYPEHSTALIDLSMELTREFHDDAPPHCRRVGPGRHRHGASPREHNTSSVLAICPSKGIHRCHKSAVFAHAGWPCVSRAPDRRCNFAPARAREDG